MANCHSTSAGLVPAVGYLRRSTSRQEKSLTDQRTEIERYAAANGYTIRRWFQDDAISGDATSCRAGFLAMHKAACNGRDFDCILVWDQDRFGRFDSMEAGYWIHPLRQAGVKLVSVNEGTINWDDFTGRVMYSLKQEGKHQFLRDLSRNVARGQISNAVRGYLCGQAAPYGYDRMIVDENGEHRQRIRNGEKFAKPRSWHTTLVPSDDAIKVQTVRWLFGTYADTDTGLRSLADKLNARGVPGPTGGAWYAASIKAILENQNYCGTFTWAKRREGKYHRVAAGQICERDRAEITLSSAGKPLATDNPREAWIVVEGAHDPLIDKAIFHRVQAKLQQRKRSNPGIGYRTHTRGNGDAYLLSGLVYCDHCGCKMHGTATTAKGHVYPKYVCSTYQRSGKSNPSGCGCHAINQDRLVAAIVRKLQAKVFRPDNLARIKAATRRQLEREQAAVDPKLVEGLRRQLTDLDREIDQAADNFLRTPAELLDVVSGKLSAMKRQREHVQESLQHAESASKPQDVTAAVEAVASRLERLGREIEAADPARRREVFRQLVDRIDLRFDHVQRGKRLECPVLSGEVTMSGDGSIFGSVSRGDRI